MHTLCEVAGKGGNLLVNVSPRGDGSLPEEQVNRLGDLGRWMSRHREAIIDTRAGLGPAHFYGPSTARPGVFYLHLLMRPYDTVDVGDVPIRSVRGVREVATGRALTFGTHAGIIESLMPEPRGTVTIELRADLLDEHARVLAIEMG